MRNREKTDMGNVGCGLLLLLPIGILVSILLAIAWDCPGESSLAYDLWSYAKIPWLIGIVLAPAGLSISAFESGGTEGCDTPVTAVIAEIIEERRDNIEGRGSFLTFTPIYSYCLNGETIRVRGRGYSTKRGKFAIGQQVQMLVSPGEPQKYCIIAESAKTRRVGGIMGGVGLALLAAGLLLWLASLGVLLSGGELF